MMKPLADYVKHVVAVLLLVSSTEGKGLDDERRTQDEALSFRGLRTLMVSNHVLQGSSTGWTVHISC